MFEFFYKSGLLIFVLFTHEDSYEVPKSKHASEVSSSVGNVLKNLGFIVHVIYLIIKQNWDDIFVFVFIKNLNICTFFRIFNEVLLINIFSYWKVVLYIYIELVEGKKEHICPSSTELGSTIFTIS